MPKNIIELNGIIDDDIFLLAELSDPINLSAEIATLDEITCIINDIFEITGIITSDAVITADIQIPNIIATELYDGTYEVKPKAYNSITLDTSGKTLIDDVVVTKIPYYETSNDTG